MKTLITTLVLSSLLFSTPVMAGPGHEHSHSHGPVSEGEATKRAIKKVKQLAKSGKIDTSWSKLKSASGAEKKTFSKGQEWVISFANDKVSDSSKRRLYIFFTLDGHYIAANYTGK